MTVESTGHSQGNPRLYELIENAPKTGKSPTVWAWPQLIDYLKVAGQPVQGPWPPHQERRPDPDDESLPVAVPDPQASAGRPVPTGSAPAQKDREADVPLPLPLRGPALARRGDRLLHDGGGDAKVLAGGQSLVPLLKLRFASPERARRHQQHPRPRRPPGRRRRHPPRRRAVPPRRPGALDDAVVTATDDGRRGAADRRPDRAQPRARSSARSATPTRRATGPRSSPRSAATSSRKGRAGRRTIPVAEFVTGPFQNVLAIDEIAVEAVIPAPKGAPPAATSSWSGASATSRPPASPSPSSARASR